MAQTQIRTGFSQIHMKKTATDAYDNPDNDGTGMFACEITGVTYNSTNFEPVYHRGDYFSMDEIPGPCSVTIAFRMPIKGSGTAGTPPKFGTFLQACAMAVTNTPVTQDQYVPSSKFTDAVGPPQQPAQAYSCSVLQDGLRFAIAGAFGNLKITATSGEPAMIEGEIMGAYQAITTDALEVAAYDASIASPFLGAAMTFGGVTPVGLRGFTFDLGNKIVFGPDANQAAGNYGARWVGRKSSGSVTYETQAAATTTEAAAWRAGTVAALSHSAVGTAGSAWRLALARCVRRGPELADADGIGTVTWNFGCSALPTDVEGANTDVSLYFT